MELPDIFNSCECDPVSEDVELTTIRLASATNIHINGILEDVLDIAVTGRETTIRR